MKKISSLLLILVVVFFASCSVEKRVHQNGYHISWKHKHAVAKQFQQPEYTKEQVCSNEAVESEPNVHSVENLSASSEGSSEIAISPRKKILSTIQTHFSQVDTVIPKQETQHEEYFSNNYTAPTRPNELQDTKLANWALGLGIGAVSTPVWVVILFVLVFAIAGATWSSGTGWAALGLAFLLGGGIFLTLEILAITFAVRFLRMLAKDPNYARYRSRAITGLVLAGIYPALILINMLLSLAMI